MNIEALQQTARLATRQVTNYPNLFDIMPPFSKAKVFAFFYDIPLSDLLDHYKNHTQKTCWCHNIDLSSENLLSEYFQAIASKLSSKPLIDQNFLSWARQHIALGLSLLKRGLPLLNKPTNDIVLSTIKNCLNDKLQAVKLITKTFNSIILIIETVTNFSPSPTTFPQPPKRSLSENDTSSSLSKRLKTLPNSISISNLSHPPANQLLCPPTPTQPSSVDTPVTLKSPISTSRTVSPPRSKSRSRSSSPLLFIVCVSLLIPPSSGDLLCSSDSPPLSQIPEILKNLTTIQTQLDNILPSPFASNSDLLITTNSSSVFTFYDQLSDWSGYIRAASRCLERGGRLFNTSTDQYFALLEKFKNLKLNFLTPAYKTKDYVKVTKETYHVGSPTGQEVSPTVKSGLNFSLALIFSQNNPVSFTLTFVNDPSLSLTNSVAYPCVMSGTLQNYPSKLKLNFFKRLIKEKLTTLESLLNRYLATKNSETPSSECFNIELKLSVPELDLAPGTFVIDMSNLEEVLTVLNETDHHLEFANKHLAELFDNTLQFDVDQDFGLRLHSLLNNLDLTESNDIFILILFILTLAFALFGLVAFISVFVCRKHMAVQVLRHLVRQHQEKSCY